jgi:hypothetical protein
MASIAARLASRVAAPAVRVAAPARSFHSSVPARGGGGHHHPVSFSPRCPTCPAWNLEQCVALSMAGAPRFALRLARQASSSAGSSPSLCANVHGWAHPALHGRYFLDQCLCRSGRFVPGTARVASLGCWSFRQDGRPDSGRRVTLTYELGRDCEGILGHVLLFRSLSVRS